MKKILQIDFRGGGKVNSIFFGIPDNNNELDQMYKLRYKVYTNKDLMVKNKDRKDFDFIDKTRNCYYFIAKLNGRVIGSTRAIFGDMLPTEDEYFDIKLPGIVKNTPRKNKVEIGRLSVGVCDGGVKPPRHLVLLALFKIMSLSLEEKGYSIALGALKNYVKEKLDKINFPLKVIEDHRLIYDPTKHNDPLVNFFNQEKTGKVWPVYGEIEDINSFFASIFDNKIIFKEINKKHLFLRYSLFFKLALLKKSIRGLW